VRARPQNAPDWQEILTHFRGSELQNYFTRILEDDLHAIIKPQYVDHIPKAVRCARPRPPRPSGARPRRSRARPPPPAPRGCAARVDRGQQRARGGS